MSILFFPLTLIVSYAFIGAGIKCLDQAADYPAHFQSRHVYLWLVTIGLVILVNIWVFFDNYTAVLALGIILGLVATRKVDSPYFFVLAVTILPLGILRIMEPIILFFVLPTLIVVFLASTLDEILHSRNHKIQTPLLRWVIAHRPLLKITVLLLPFLGLLTFDHTIAFWGFDIAYDLVAYYYSASISPNP